MQVIRIPWLSDRPRWFRITAIAMVFTGLAVGLSYLIVDTVHKSGETACLADSLDRKFRRGIDFSKLSTEKRAQIKREAMISAYVLIKGQSGTSASHCHKGWEVVGNIKGLGWRIAKALIGVTPSRNHRKELMQEVAFEAMRDRFSGIDTGAVTGVCTYRASKIRQAVPPWVLEPFAGWKKCTAKVVSLSTASQRTTNNRPPGAANHIAAPTFLYPNRLRPHPSGCGRLEVKTI